VRLHHAELLPEDRVWVGHVPVTSALRTLQDCAALPIAPDLLRQAAADAVARGLARSAQVAHLTARASA
jgi:hypothetical protein